MDWTDMQNWITAISAVLTLLGAGGGALWKVCRLLKDGWVVLAQQIETIQQQNAVQSTQITALTAAVQQLQQWAMGRGEGGR